ncbi:hypothetical protein [Pelagerythrobacter aerophilus]|uniref:hypothetical protein n=1 Tax=Pelagerythrobacter aerophilus TaxID=2306995 RepID=UPI0016008E29|nr:hypothetical protein [Pelagerythrobacter aerophilus]
MPISRALGRIADFWASRKVTLRFTADFRIASFSLPLIKRLLADTADGETYRCSIAEWPFNERPPLHVHRGVVSTLRVDGPLQAAGKTYLPLGGLIEAPFVTAHLDPVETQRLDCRVQEAIEQTIADWICEHRLHDRPRARREIDRAKADRAARAVIDRWVAEHSSKPEAGNTSGLSVSSSHDCCSGKTSGSLCRACRNRPNHD